MRRPFIICYDIASDRQRRRVFSKLSCKGYAAQRSVFLLRMAPAEAPRLEAQLTQMISPGDSVLVLPVLQDASLPEFQPRVV